MTKRLSTAVVIRMLVIVAMAAIPAAGQGGRGGRGMMGDGAHGAEPTPGGVRVIQTSMDAYVVRLLHAHADAVSAFLANGMSEMMRNHPVPPR